MEFRISGTFFSSNNFFFSSGYLLVPIIPQKVILFPISVAFCAMIKSSIESPTYRQCEDPIPLKVLIKELGFGFASSRDSSSKKIEFSISNSSNSSSSE